MVENSVATRQQKTVRLRFAQIKGQFTQCPLWRGSLLPLGRAAALNPATSVIQAHRIRRAYDCCAAERDGTVRRSDKLPRHRV